jgi:hypothetical protein
MIAEKEVQIVRDDIIRSGVDYIPLQNELVDHIITEIEKFMLVGKSFEKAYNEVKAYLDYKNVDFFEVQKDTKTLLDYKSRFLKALTISVMSITLIGFGFKYFKISGGSMIQLLSFFLLSVLFFRFALLFYRDKRHGVRKKSVAILYGIVGLFLPISHILHQFLPQHHAVATLLSMTSYLLLSISVLIYLKTYSELNIFGIEQATRKADLLLVHANIVCAILSLFLNTEGLQMALPYLLYGILSVNTLWGLFLIIAYRFTNRLTSMFIISVVTMHIYFLPSLIR